MNFNTCTDLCNFHHNQDTVPSPPKLPHAPLCSYIPLTPASHWSVL